MNINTGKRVAGRAPMACVLAVLLVGCAEGAAETPAGATPPLLTISAPSTLVLPSPTVRPPATPTVAPTRVQPAVQPTAPPAVVTPTPIPIPTPLALVILPSGTGDGPPDLTGNLRSLDGAFETDIHASGKTLLRFSDKLEMELDVTAIPAGARVREVLFRFTSLDDAIDFDSRIERTSDYCSFGGGEPNCNVLRLTAGARWPNSGDLITNGVYCLSSRALLDNGATRTWRLLVEIANPALPPDPTGGTPPISGTVPLASPCLR